MQTLQELYEEAKGTMKAHGHEVSAWSWIDEEQQRFYVGSVKTIPGTYGHGAAEISFNCDWLSMSPRSVFGNAVKYAKDGDGYTPLTDSDENAPEPA